MHRPEEEEEEEEERPDRSVYRSRPIQHHQPGVSIDWLDSDDVLALANHAAVDQLALRYNGRLDTA